MADEVKRCLHCEQVLEPADNGRQACRFCVTNFAKVCVWCDQSRVHPAPGQVVAAK